MAVMVTVPWPTAVARPVFAPMVAICTLLEDHATALVRSTVAPVEVVPIAMNWLVCLGAATDCELGMMARATTAAPGEVDEVPVTVSVAEAEITPVYPFMLAVIVVEPDATPVATPVELMVATAGTLEVQVTESVMSCVVEGWLLP
jgi:hypothetical protein